MNLSIRLKITVFRAAFESVLVYGYVPLTLITLLEKNIDGIYPRILRAVTNQSCRDYLTNEQLYGVIPNIIKSIHMQKLRFACH